jgi:parallel beta-helix repeat protein
MLRLDFDTFHVVRQESGIEVCSKTLISKSNLIMLKKERTLRRLVSSLIVALLFLSLFVFTFTVLPAKAQSGTIIINPNGSITPSNANITTSDKVTYTFNGDNDEPIVVQRSNIIIDGAGHTLRGNELGTNGTYWNGINNVTLKNLNIKGFSGGVYVENSTHNKIVSTNIAACGNGICLYSSSNNVLSGDNVTADNATGIYIEHSSDYNTLSGNNVTANHYDGIEILSSDKNTLSGNIVAKSQAAIYLDSSSGNVLSRNNFTANSLFGVWLYNSSGNVVYGNNITANQYNGIYLYSSSNNFVSGNNVAADGTYGVWIYYYSENNTLSGNNIANSYYGIYSWDSSGNRIFHNCLISNTLQTGMRAPNMTNLWDDGYPSGGNYWSDYRTRYPKAAENDSSGIWNTPYVINTNNTDRCPLMGPFHTFSVGTWGGIAYSVDTISNSTITNLSFNQLAKTLTFNVTGPSGTTGFCRVAIPLSLMSGGWTVTVNGAPVSYSTATDANYTYIYFTYHHSTETVQITSISVIPEFQPSMLLPLFMIVTLIGSIILKKKRLLALVHGAS